MPGVLRVVGVVLLGIGVVLVAAAVAVYVVSENKLNQTLSVPTENVPIPTDTSALQRGQHLAAAVGVCVDCHGMNLAGKVYIDDQALGRIVSANLTRGRGGVGATYSDADMARAIRHGVSPTGRMLLIMPSDDYHSFSDADLGAIIAYIRSLPSVDSSLPANELRPLGRLLVATGQLPVQPALDIPDHAARPAAPPMGMTPEYGKYLADIAGCSNCHGPGLSGGVIPEAPPGTLPAANLTPEGLGAWSEADFFKAMRTGTRPDGRVLDTFMPWPYYAQMTDEELRSLWRFLQVIPPRPTGSR
jgi:mono/diheme cytochrome c family protein